MTKITENIINKALSSIDSISITTEQLRQAIDAITAFNDGAMVFINNCELYSYSVTDTSVNFNCTASIVPLHRLQAVTIIR